MLDIGLFFPTVIGSETNKKLANYMLPLAKKYLNEINSNNNLDYKSTYTSGDGIELYQEVKPFVEYIDGKAKEFLEKNGYDVSKIKLKPKIFVSQMLYGDFHNSHVHPNCILSGIMYLQVPEGSSPILFSDNRIEKRMRALPKIEETPLNQLEIPVFPKEGLLLMWESWLAHSVPKNYSKEERITIVFNFSAV